MQDAYGLYIHIPFCRSKCGYCDFLSFPDASYEIKKAYKDALINEIKLSAICNPIDTVYIGGGTPTALPSLFLQEMLHSLQLFNLTANFELTVEANPGTLSKEILSMLKENGVNRLSIGLQAWQNHLLKAIGRGHTWEEFEINYQTARGLGFNNISVDLMFALPGQTMDDWHKTLTRVIGLQPEHISAYSLTPEEGTPIWESRGILPDEETDRAMYHLANRLLAKAGYVHYELSNHAQPGFKSRHNTRYWKRRPYLGFGLGAHSFDGKARYHNTDDLQTYIKNKNLRGGFVLLTDEDALSEKLFLGLRLMEGVNASLFGKYEADATALVHKGLLERVETNFRLTPLGMDLANRVFSVFV